MAQDVDHSRLRKAASKACPTATEELLLLAARVIEGDVDALIEADPPPPPSPAPGLSSRAPLTSSAAIGRIIAEYFALQRNLVQLKR